MLGIGRVSERYTIRGAVCRYLAIISSARLCGVCSSSVEATRFAYLGRPVHKASLGNVLAKHGYLSLTSASVLPLSCPVQPLVRLDVPM